MESVTTNGAPSVSDVARDIRVALRDLGDGWVEGEVQSINAHRSGHVYLTLAGESASIEACIWKGRRHRYGPLPKQGDLVKAHYERIDFYAPRGSTKLIVDRLEPTGEGELLRRRAQTLRRLQAEGLCDPARRRALVAFPRRVGVIAAHDAKRDVIDHLRTRLPAQDIAFCAAAVQGVEAVGSMLDALGRLQSVTDVDVIVLARGGGSVADLVPFDDERLCRAIATSRVPVVTSIGHTKDRPNCDHVAAAYAAVPAKAAELAIAHSAEELIEELDQVRSALDTVARHLGERAAAVSEIWERIRPHQRLAGLVAGLATTADLLVSRAEAAWRGRELALTSTARELDALGTRLWRPRSLELLREQLHAAGAAFFTDHLRALDEHRGSLESAASRVPKPTSLDVFAAQLENVAGLIKRRRRDYGRAFDRHAQTAASAVGRRVARERTDVGVEGKQLCPVATRVITAAGREIEVEATRLRPAAMRSLVAAKRELDDDARGLRPAADRVLRRASERADALGAVIDAKDLRRRGWVLASDEHGRAVAAVADLSEGDAVHLRFADGEAAASIENVRPHDE